MTGGFHERKKTVMQLATCSRKNSVIRACNTCSIGMKTQHGLENDSVHRGAWLGKTECAFAWDHMHGITSKYRHTTQRNHHLTVFQQTADRLLVDLAWVSQHDSRAAKRPYTMVH